MKKGILGLAGLLAMASGSTFAQNVTVDVTGTFSGDRNVLNSSGTAANGLQVEVGYFDTAGGFDINNAAQGSIADLQAMGAHWHQFGSTVTTTTSPSSGLAGSFSYEGIGTSPGSLRIDLWIFNTGGAALAGDYGNVADYGLFTGPVNNSDTTLNWTFPTGGAFPGNTASLSTVDLVNGNHGVAGIAYFGQIVSSANPNGSLELSAAVPEPSSAALVVLGLVSSLAFRRVRA